MTTLITAAEETNWLIDCLWLEKVNVCKLMNAALYVLSVALTNILRARLSVKPGTFNIPVHSGT